VNQPSLSVAVFILDGMESASFGGAGHPVVAALDAMSDALDKAAAADVWSLSDDDLSATTEWCERLAARQAALALRLVREVDARDLGRRQGAPSTAAWLAGRLRLRPGEAKTRVELANRLDPHAPDGPVDYAANVTAPAVGALPATAAALAVGAVSVDHACVVAKTMTALPAGVGSEQARIAESELAGYAAQFDPVTVGRLGRYLIHLLDSDTLEEREQRAYRRRELRLVDLGDGLTRLSGQLDTESAAVVRSALNPLAAPNSDGDGTADPRTAAQRMADALVELARRTCHSGGLPAGHGVRPHLNVIIGLDSLRTAAVDCGVPPGELGCGGPISTEAVRRIGCDAGITRIITGPASVPLDVGREHRTVSTGQWAALTARDRGCAFPGCTRPADWCDAHHIIHWADGGATDVDNLVLLCGHHHRVIHHSGWQVRIADDRHPEFLPPPWINADRTPRRNTRPRYNQDLPGP
jgi:hypothetical protein